MTLALVILELGLMIWLRKEFVSNFVRIVIRFGGSMNSAVWCYSILSLPGVLTHEIAHFLMAAFLGLRTGSIELLPKLTNGGGVEFGSVQVEKSDPLRLSLVGLAPVLMGLPIVAWLSVLMQQALWADQTWLVIGLGYGITTITIHLLPSGKDMATWPVTILLLGLMSLAMVKINKILELKWEQINFPANATMLTAISKSLLVPLVALIVGSSLFFLINSIMRKR